MLLTRLPPGRDLAEADDIGRLDSRAWIRGSDVVVEMAGRSLIPVRRTESLAGRKLSRCDFLPPSATSRSLRGYIRGAASRKSRCHDDRLVMFRLKMQRRRVRQGLSLTAGLQCYSDKGINLSTAAARTGCNKIIVPQKGFSNGQRRRQIIFQDSSRCLWQRNL